jgi:hypothetical protein
MTAADEPTNVARLRVAVERLEAAYERRRQQFLEAIEQSPGLDAVPEDTRDSMGRPILLDALTAIVTARAVLALADATGGE